VVAAVVVKKNKKNKSGIQVESSAIKYHSFSVLKAAQPLTMFDWKK
jgi:hypothetical protein